MRIVITGTPGTGKTTIGKALAKKTRATFVEVNQLVKQNKLYTAIEDGEMVADLKRLEKTLKKLLAAKTNFVVEGHLACEFRIPCDVIIILRCEPRHLWNRLKKRRYSFQKIKENTLAEILDYCTTIAEKNYPKTKIIQINSTKKLSTKKLLEKIRNKESEKLDWTKYLETHEKLFRNA